MHQDPMDLDSMPVGPRRGSNANGIGTPRTGGKAPPSALQATQAPGGAAKKKKLLIAENLYRAEHEDGADRPRQSRRASTGIPSARPQLLMCYLCGQQFGTSSLHIHQPQCYVKKLLQWERTDPAVRGPKPISPDEFQKSAPAPPVGTGGNGGFGGGGAPGGIADQPISTGRGQAQTIEEFNNAQFKNYTEKMLVPCENCGRTFLPDRLVVHQRSCKPGKGSKKVGAAKAADDAAATKPATDNVPKSFDDIPIRPKGASGGAEPAGGTATSASSTNGAGAASKRPSLAAPAGPELVPCKYCGRTFAPARIEKHEGVCIAQKTVDITPATARRPGSSTPTIKNGSLAGASTSARPPATARGPPSLESPRPGTPTKARRPSGGVSDGGRGASESQPFDSTTKTTGSLRSPGAARPKVSTHSNRRPGTPQAAPVTPRQPGGNRTERPTAAATSAAGGVTPRGTATKRPSTTLSASSSVNPTPVPAERVSTPRRANSPSVPTLLNSLDELARDVASKRASDTALSSAASTLRGGNLPAVSPRGGQGPAASTGRSSATTSPPAYNIPGSTTDDLTTTRAPRPAATSPEYRGGKMQSNTAETDSICTSDSPGAERPAQRPSAVTPDLASLRSVSPGMSTTTTTPGRPKFCHECGSRLATATAKFCSECGTKLGA